VETYNALELIRNSNSLRKFRAFLDEVVRVMDDCDIQPWPAANEQEKST
jgi:hypothetical protein